MLNSLKEIVEKFGKEKINTFTKYASILTMHQLWDKWVLKDELTTDISWETMYATEKIDGTNVRIVYYKWEYLVGSRDEILYYSEDLYYAQNLGIVDRLHHIIEQELWTPELWDWIWNSVSLSEENSDENMYIFYGELFGGNIGKYWKEYGGKNDFWFRLFDIVEVKPEEFEIMYEELPRVSSWREHSIGTALEYGQNFLSVHDRESRFPHFQYVPTLELNFESYEHNHVLEKLEEVLPETMVKLTDDWLGQSEWVVLRNHNRTKIVKVRFQDYKRTLKFKNK